jgi:hypothetical protein
MNRTLSSIVRVSSTIIWLFFNILSAIAEPPEITVIRPDLQTGLANAGWNHDRYPDLPPLDAHKTITVADLKGPGIIRHIHFTRHNPVAVQSLKELAARGVVLEIWFDDAKEPAVQCPLADFFGDGCNGGSMDFSSTLIECAPLSYNCYIPMPFKSRARVLLRNDTDQNLSDYSYVEWENLPEWNDKLGYFHAAFDRRCVQLSKTSDEMFFEVQGTGHLIGRQFSIVTDEPFFRGLAFVVEGNNDVDIDGQPRKLEYLGTEDSFTFSWGFPRPYAGQRAGITLIKPDLPSMVSLYRLHDHMPIRFNKSLCWHINWIDERECFDGWNKPSLEEKAPFGSKWAASLAKGGCWVDFATVYYWYQTVPGGYRHKPLPPVAERAMPMLPHTSEPTTKAP